MSREHSAPPPELARALRLPHATALVVGTILGAAIFVQPSEIARLVPSVGEMIGVWVVSGLLTFCGALVCAELASAFPATGGVYLFLKEIFSPLLGFLWGWAMFWVMHSGIVAAMAVIFARYFGHFVPLDDAGQRGAAIAAILALSAVNYFGVKPGSIVQTALTLAKVLAVAIFLAAAFFLVTPESAALSPAASPRIAPGDFLQALVAGLFAFGGWHMVTFAAGETRAPERTIPRALLLGTAVVTLCYVGLNAAYLHVLPLEKIISSTRVAADAATAVVGPRGAAVISATVLLSVFGALSGVVLAGPRVYFAMAQSGQAPRWLGAVHAKFLTPHRAIVAQAAWSSFLVATGTYRELFTRVIYTEWIFFGLLALGIFLLRRKPGYAPAYRLPAAPLVAGVFVISSLAIVSNQLWHAPLESASGLLLVAAGIPVYFAQTLRRKRSAA
jgi:APA family basic amino acid/polyamine antiporter